MAPVGPGRESQSNRAFYIYYVPAVDKGQSVGPVRLARTGATPDSRKNCNSTMTCRTAMANRNGFALPQPDAEVRHE